MANKKYEVVVAQEIELGTIRGSEKSDGSKFVSESKKITLTSPKISWQNLSVLSTTLVSKVADSLSIDSQKYLFQSPAQKNYIVNNVSGEITGGLNAIFGPSGSGKTTFVNALARRLDSLRLSVSGESLINDQTYTHNDLKSFSGYVMQVCVSANLLF